MPSTPTAPAQASLCVWPSLPGIPPGHRPPCPTQVHLSTLCHHIISILLLVKWGCHRELPAHPSQEAEVFSSGGLRQEWEEKKEGFDTHFKDNLTRLVPAPLEKSLSCSFAQ